MGKSKEENSQGGGLHGGPKRWTGTGPRPARHIPWPELFKHHQSVLTGHLKMMDMVRKHCAPGSGNYETAEACVNRTHEMLRDFKKVVFNFVPPKDNIDRVPLGASSASMYPGYSPADHVYGEAAQEFGSTVAELRKKGKDWKPEENGPEYVIGQSTLSEKQQREQYRKQKSQSVETDQGGDSRDGVEATKSDSEPLWFVDSNPTPVNVADTKSKKEKRRVSFEGGEEGKPSQKKKKIEESQSVVPAVAEDDISTEVEARLKSKEEKRKKKKGDQKRKRDSVDSSLPADTTNTTTSEPAPVEKPKKKKSKSQVVEGENPQPEETIKAEKEGKHKKKRGDSTEMDDEGEKRKKRKKDA